MLRENKVSRMVKSYVATASETSQNLSPEPVTTFPLAGSILMAAAGLYRSGRKAVSRLFVSVGLL
jgi:hypothetical protein